MNEVAFRQVDVFTTIPFKGNPVAVVMDARGLTADEMQAIAHWTNLSETTFVLPAEHEQADYRVRIFTPGGELPFAGHPTIGTAFALLEAGNIKASAGRIVQECGAGLIELHVSDTGHGQPVISFELPKPVLTPLDEAQVSRLETLLNCSLNRKLTPSLVDVGARWIVAYAGSAQAVLNSRPDYAGLREHDREMNVTGTCIYGEYFAESGNEIEVRSFAPAYGVNEDPVCGSGNGSVAAFMRRHNVSLPEDGLVFSSQGRVLNRDGKIQLTIADRKILVGGCAVICIRGSICC